MGLDPILIDLDRATEAPSGGLSGRRVESAKSQKCTPHRVTRPPEPPIFSKEKDMVTSRIRAFCMFALAVAVVGYAADSGPERKIFYQIYKEMVETNTTHSVGDTTLAARNVQKRLLDAGFSPDDVQLFEPF